MGLISSAELPQPMFAASISAAASLVLVVFAWWLLRTRRVDSTAKRNISDGTHLFGGIRLRFESQHDPHFPVVTCTFVADPVQDNELASALGFLLRVLEQPLTFCADTSNFSVIAHTPSVKQIRTVMDWTKRHALLLDTHVQGYAVVLPNPVLQGIVRTALAVCAPPQPLGTCASEADARAFLEQHCTAPPRSFARGHYAPDGSRIARAPPPREMMCIS